MYYLPMIQQSRNFIKIRHFQISRTKHAQLSSFSKLTLDDVPFQWDSAIRFQNTPRADHSRTTGAGTFCYHLVTSMSLLQYSRSARYFNIPWLV